MIVACGGADPQVNQSAKDAHPSERNRSDGEDEQQPQQAGMPCVSAAIE
jgi:hypothetical protein